MQVGEGQDWAEGEQQAWELLSYLDSESVCLRAQAEYNETGGCYILCMFGGMVSVSPKSKEIRGDSEIAELILKQLPHYSRLSILWYLVSAKDIPLSGILINPRGVNGGLIFASGSHVLPLDKLIERYGNDIDGFVRKGITLGGERLDYGDASLKLTPLPRVPLTLILWKADEEFPARADILFDSTCSSHLPTDIIWSTAMMSILVMAE